MRLETRYEPSFIAMMLILSHMIQKLALTYMGYVEKPFKNHTISFIGNIPAQLVRNTTKLNLTTLNFVIFLSFTALRADGRKEYLLIGQINSDHQQTG